MKNLFADPWNADPKIFSDQAIFEIPADYFVYNGNTLISYGFDITSKSQIKPNTWTPPINKYIEEAVFKKFCEIMSLSSKAGSQLAGISRLPIFLVSKEEIYFLKTGIHYDMYKFKEVKSPSDLIKNINN